MKAATVKQIKDELKLRSPNEIMELCLRLSRFKKENKELLTYLLFEADDEPGYVKLIKEEIDDQFDEINATRIYYVKKGVRKILRGIKKHIRYSNSKETEVELLLYFCHKMESMKPSIKRNSVLLGLYLRQVEMTKKRIDGLHEDLQYDYGLEVENLALYQNY